MLTRGAGANVMGAREVPNQAKSDHCPDPGGDPEDLNFTVSVEDKDSDL